MAGNKSEATLLLRFKDEASKGLNSIKKVLGTLKKHFVAVTAAIAAVGYAIHKFAGIASEFETVSEAFNKMAMSQGQDAQAMLDNMRRLSKGTVSDLELMKQANTAMMLGLPVEKFGEMIEVARSAAKATGQSMDFMFQSIVIGLGRQSKLVLDNLGIMIDIEGANKRYAASLGIASEKLTEAQKKQAFINEALRIGTENAKKAGSGTIDYKDRVAQLSAAWTNFSVVIGKFLTSTGSGVIQWLIKGLELATNFADNLRIVLGVKSSDTLSRIQEVNDEIKKTKDSIMQLEKSSGIFSNNSKIIEMQKNRLVELNSELDTLNKKQKDQAANAANLQGAKTEQENIDSQIEAAINNQRLINEAKQAEIDFGNMTEAEKQLAWDAFKIEQALKSEQDKNQILALEKQKAGMLDQKAKNAEIEREKKLSEQKKQISANMMGAIAALMAEGGAKTFKLWQASALAEAIIAAHLAISKALASSPPPWNFVAAAAVGIQSALQVRNIAMAKPPKLAEGGIVKATEGGVPAIIGEGGRNEAVIPLDDNMGGGMGTTIVNITVNGGMLGTPSEAREFARVIDKELFGLRRANESIAFDRGL